MKLLSCVATFVTAVIYICILPWMIQSNTIDPRYHATTCLLEYSRSITFDYYHNCYVALFAYRPIKYNNIVKVIEVVHTISRSSLLTIISIDYTNCLYDHTMMSFYRIWFLPSIYISHLIIYLHLYLYLHCSYFYMMTFVMCLIIIINSQHIRQVDIMTLWYCAIYHRWCLI